MTETCSTCRFGHIIPHEGVENTCCRIDPPEFIPPNSTCLKPVQPTGWCGKWATKVVVPHRRAVR